MSDQDLYLDFLSIYTEEELVEIEDIIDHSIDFTLAYAQVKKAMSSYLLKDRASDQIYETPQFMCMRIALAVCENEENRVEAVRTIYNYLAHFNISLPTPMWVNLGTPNKIGTSCLLYSTDDTRDSLNAGDNISYILIMTLIC